MRTRFGAVIVLRVLAGLFKRDASGVATEELDNEIRRKQARATELKTVLGRWQQLDFLFYREEFPAYLLRLLCYSSGQAEIPRLAQDFINRETVISG
jgi:hypothetical protein